MFGRNKTPETSPAQAHDRPDDTVLVDVREPDEWNAGHAPGATHVPLSKVGADTVPTATTILCVCRSGGRSGQATAVLRAAGLNAINVTGGMNAWNAAGLPVACDDGSPGTVA